MAHHGIYDTSWKLIFSQRRKNAQPHSIDSETRKVGAHPPSSSGGETRGARVFHDRSNFMIFVRFRWDKAVEIGDRKQWKFGSTQRRICAPDFSRTHNVAFAQMRKPRWTRFPIKVREPIHGQPDRLLKGQLCEFLPGLGEAGDQKGSWPRVPSLCRTLCATSAEDPST